MKGREWINFKELRARLKFAEVLAHYKVEVRQKGNQHLGPCPLPHHGGTRKGLSFSASLEKGIFQCFSCGTKGNILEFAALMSGVDPKDGSALRKVAVELQLRFCPEGASRSHRPSDVTPRAPINSASAPKQAVNAPLDFTLKDLDATHPFLDHRGLSAETIAYFGLGFCSRGLLKGRLAIPMHDPTGSLVGYSGRVVEESAVTADNPRYSFPESRERNGVRYEFDRTLLLYNSHRVKAPADSLVVVQGFSPVWCLHQCGIQHVVGIITDELSDRQSEIILSLTKPGGSVWILPDGGREGVLLAQETFRKIAPSRFVRWVRLGNDERPGDLPAERLRSRLPL